MSSFPGTLLLAVGGPVAVAALVVAALVARVDVRPTDGVLVGLPPAGIVGLALGWWFGLDVPTVLFWGVLLALAWSFGVVRVLDRPGGAWLGALRSRLLFGVPWGTLVSIVGVVAFYLFVQNGLADPYRPLQLPFTSWSYLYPLGVVTAPFAHTGLGHLTGNLLATATLAPVAEYAWSHFPTGRGESAFSSWKTDPYVRAFLVFPLAVVGVALATSLFSWGAIIGFSGVVFAFAGFALVRFPVATVVAAAVNGAVSTVYYALRDPVVVASASPSYGGPWWAGIAIQGHVLGLFLGAVLGALLLARRRARPSALRLWGGAFVFAVTESLWIVWWYRGPSTFVLYRGLGIAMVAAIALLFALAVRARGRPVFTWDGETITRKHLALALVLVPVFFMAGVAVPVNLVDVTGEELPNEGIHVRDYDVTYAENVPNQRVSAIPLDAFRGATRVNASGVIVRNPDRHIWTEAISKGVLAFYGTSSVKVGGVGWSETIQARREGWVVAGGEPVYRVALRRAGGTWDPVFQSDTATADPTIAHRNVTLAVTETAFRVRVTRGNETLGAARLPAKNETVTVGGLRLVREGTRLFAVHDGTRVQVAHEEQYE